MSPYLPEWKLYLWKKLLLDRPDPEAVLSVDDFLYFDQTEYRKLSMKHTQKMIDSIPQRMIIRNGVVVGADNSMDTPSADYYYSFKPQSILLSLIELAEQKPPCMEITEITIKKGFIDNYRNERKKYLAEHDKKRMASLTNPMGHVWVSNPDQRYTDPFCGLSQFLYEKIENDEEVNLTDLKEFASSTDGSSMISMASFKVSLNRKNMSAYVDKYIDDFILGNLIAADSVRYFQFQHQKDNIFGTIKGIAVKFGAHNMVITSEEIAKYGGWEYRDERHYRFYETLFALEKLGEIEIKQLRGSEIIISIIENKPDQKTVVEMKDDVRERFNKEYNPFGIKRNEIIQLSNQLNQYKEKVTSVNQEVAAKRASGQLPSPTKDPITKIEHGQGYLIFNGEQILIGDHSSGKFKLAEILCNVKFGTAKNIDFVFEMVRPKKDKNKSDESVSDSYIGAKRRLSLLENYLKEINRAITIHVRSRKLKNFTPRLKLKTDSSTHPKSVWFENRVGRRGK